MFYDKKGSYEIFIILWLFKKNQESEDNMLLISCA